MKNRLKGYLKILVEHEIVRRYVIINSFDGALTILGIVIAEFFSAIQDPKLVILPGLGAAVAMCISGIWGAYSAERAEVRKSIRTMEAHLIKDLSNTAFSKKREKMAIAIGFVDGLSPLVASLLILVPFFFVSSGMITMQFAYYLSLAAVTVILFLLGAFAGRIARESMVKHGLIMLLAGLIIGLIFFLLVLAGVL
ncbi:VIT1/CCC1 transporter family protein [Candidatus Woesearchaeota archaeon]|nr:VIT1/CCC1 transporter family protein [Candidatus Woesearchaeota archaeon]